MHSSAQEELERNSHGLMGLHESQQRQLKVEHAQLAELHAQAGLALRSLSEQHDAMRTEVEAHRATQQQLVELQRALQRERDNYLATGGEVPLCHKNTEALSSGLRSFDFAETYAGGDSFSYSGGGATRGGCTPTGKRASPRASPRSVGAVGAKPRAAAQS